MSIFVIGMAGGMIRGLVGFVKHQFSYKNVPFEIPYFISMLLISGLIGSAATAGVAGMGLLEASSPAASAMALVVGYAGGDFLENLAKIILKKPSWFKLPGA